MATIKTLADAEHLQDLLENAKEATYGFLGSGHHYILCKHLGEKYGIRKLDRESCMNEARKMIKEYLDETLPKHGIHRHARA